MHSLAYVITVAYNYWKTDMMWKVKSSQKDESLAKHADSSRAY